jgi:hypothetical protein
LIDVKTLGKKSHDTVSLTPMLTLACFKKLGLSHTVMYSSWIKDGAVSKFLPGAGAASY